MARRPAAASARSVARRPASGPGARPGRRAVPDDGSAAAGVGVDPCVVHMGLGIEQGHLAEPLRRFGDGQRPAAVGRGIGHADGAVDDEVQAVGQVAAPEQALPRHERARPRGLRDPLLQFSAEAGEPVRSSAARPAGLPGWTSGTWRRAASIAALCREDDIVIGPSLQRSSPLRPVAIPARRNLPMATALAPIPTNVTFAPLSPRSASCCRTATTPPGVPDHARAQRAVHAEELRPPAEHARGTPAGLPPYRAGRAPLRSGLHRQLRARHGRRCLPRLHGGDRLQRQRPGRGVQPQQRAPDRRRLHGSAGVRATCTTSGT